MQCHGYLACQYTLCVCRWLMNLNEYGVCLLKDLPVEPSDQLLKVWTVQLLFIICSALNHHF